MKINKVLPRAFMKGSKFSCDSSWYFPAKDMVTDSEGEVRGAQCASFIHKLLLGNH